MSTDLQNKSISTLQMHQGIVVIFYRLYDIINSVKHHTFTVDICVAKEAAASKRSNQFVLAEQFIDPLVIKDQAQILKSH